MSNMENFQQKNSPLLTPTYQSVLSKALMDVINARNNHDIELEWTCLETLYYISPDCVIKEINTEIEKLINKLRKITTQATNQTIAERILLNFSHTYKKNNVDTLFKIIMDSLRKNKYTEFQWGARPLNPNTPHIGVNQQ